MPCEILARRHYVVHPDRLEAPLVELGQARVKQLLHGLTALGAQLTVLRGRPSAE